MFFDRQTEKILFKAYEENKYLVALAKRGSPLSSVLPTTTPLRNPSGS